MERRGVTSWLVDPGTCQSTKSLELSMAIKSNKLYVNTAVGSKEKTNKQKSSFQYEDLNG